MPLGWANPHLVRSGSYGTRPYGAGMGARLASSIATGIGAFIEGEEFTFVQLPAQPVLAHISFIPQPISSLKSIYIQAFPYYQIHCYVQGSQESKPVPNGDYGNVTLPLITGYTPGDAVRQHVAPDVALTGYTSDGVYERHAAPDVTLNAYEGDIPRTAIRRLVKFQGVYMYGNAFGVSGVLGAQGAYIEVADPISSAKHAYIKTPEFLVAPGKAAFISGHDSDRWTKHAHIFSTEEKVESNSAYIAGLAKERFSTFAFIQIATPTGSSVGGYVHSATPMWEENSAFVRGAGRVIAAPQFAWTTGLDRDWFTHHAFIQIETPRTASRAAFIVGPPITSTKPAYMFGIYIGLPTKRAFIQIETPMFKAKPAYIRGYTKLPATTKPAYLDSHFAQRVSKSAFIQILTPMQRQQSSYVSGPLSLVTTKRAFIDGINQESVSKRIHTFGHYVTPPSAVSAYVHIEEFRDKYLNAFIKVGEPVFAPKRAWINGQEEIHANAVGLYIDSRELIFKGQPAFLQIQNPMNAPVKRAFLQIETPMNAGVKRAHIRNVGILQQPLNAYTLGGFRQNTSKQAYIQIHTPQPVIPKLCYIENVTFASKSLGCYIFETGIDNYTQICYLNGYWEGAVDVTKGAYIGGHNSLNYIGTENTPDVESGTPGEPDMGCFISGAIKSLVKTTRAFVVNYGLIGDWELDDGNGDAGTAHADDTSTVDNDGNLKNWPTWVGGPHGEDC